MKFDDKIILFIFFSALSHMFQISLENNTQKEIKP